jgi:hypothetical protein
MSSDINVQTFSGKVNITSNLLVGTSHLFVDTINNRVGLVTSNPDAGLHVNSNAYVHTDFRVGSGIVMNDTSGRITAGSFVGDGSAMTGINSDSGSWVNGTNSNVHLATTTDKVGIGVTDPATTGLHVANSYNPSGGNTTHFDPQIYISGDTGTSGTQVSAIGFNGNSASVGHRRMVAGSMYYKGTTGNYGMDGYLGLAVADVSTGGADPYGLTEGELESHTRLAITNAGNVGIGVTSPQTNLHIESSGSTGLDIYGGDTNNPYIFIGEHTSSYSRKWGMKMNYYGNSNIEWFNMAVVDDNTEIDALTFRRNGNVGIGTTSPVAKLEVHNSGAAASIGDLVTDFTGSWIRIGDARSSRTFSGGSGIKFHDSGVAHYSVGQLDGKFKISVSSGDGNSLFPSGYIEGITLNTSGKVGIGTSDPQSLLQVPRPAVAYDKVIQLGTQTTYADGDLYSLGFGGNALMGIGLATGTRSVFGRQGMATHIPNTETWGIYTNSWTKLINVDGSTRRVYFGHTDKFNLFYAPSAWSYSSSSTTDTNLWTFSVSIPQEGYLIVNANGHWSNNTANTWFYGKIGVDSADPADTSGFYDNYTVGGSASHGGDFHAYKDSSVSWQDFNWSGTFKVAAGTRTICMRVRVSGGTLSLNGTAVNMLYIPKNYF